MHLQIKQSTASVQLSTLARADTLRQLGVDEVIVATGAQRLMSWWARGYAALVIAGDACGPPDCE
ncbi:MAG: hypothetical protein IMF06_13060 [Proteobacteria bacterium]|nr:hypothetical protein [Pseudomonadota bacterium]